MQIVSTRTWFHEKSVVSRLELVYDGILEYRPALGGAPAGWYTRTRAPAPLAFGFCCEDRDRGLSVTLSPRENARLKVAKVTAIPATEGGEPYRVLRTWSNRFKKPMMELQKVPAYVGIRAHPGNSDVDTEGCQLPGLFSPEPHVTVTHSKDAWEWLDARVSECEARGEAVTWAILRDGPAWEAFRALAA